MPQEEQFCWSDGDKSLGDIGLGKMESGDRTLHRKFVAKEKQRTKGERGIQRNNTMFIYCKGCFKRKVKLETTDREG